jgi:HNH endonuclease
LSAHALREFVEAHAGGHCEYCRAPQHAGGYRFHREHIHPLVQGGPDTPDSRALACASCNLAKADKVSGIDPLTGAEAALFNPHMQAWEAHFGWMDDQQTIAGRTLTGRATILTLDMNSELRRGARLLWFVMALLP